MAFDALVAWQSTWRASPNSITPTQPAALCCCDFMLLLLPHEGAVF
jgi:hypothetical protein